MARTPRVSLHLGDCVSVLAGLPADSIDACVTDPPYDLLQASRKGSTRTNEPGNAYGRHGSRGFMGMTWDATGVAFRSQTWEAVGRVLKPGAHLLAFGGTRTYHRMVCAIEDAGFEIRDSLTWLYGSGFPKNTNIGRALGARADLAQGARSEWAGWGTALKPGHETIVLARKPISERSVAENVLRHGTGALNIDACRIPSGDDHRRKCASVAGIPRHGRGNCYADMNGVRTDPFSPLGRWPANVLLTHQPGCTATSCAVGCPVAEVDRQTGVSRSRVGKPRASVGNPSGFRTTHTGTEHDDIGGASRFYYVAKAARAEREAGLGAHCEQPLMWSAGTKNPGSFQSAGTHRAAANFHPCVKPVTLMRYVCRLVTRPSGTVLDPFMGSGSTGLAALLEGFDFVGIEAAPEYHSIAEARLSHQLQRGDPREAA